MRLLGMYSKWEKSRNERFLSALEFNPCAKVVDLGCGSGEFSMKAKERIGCQLIWGIDMRQESLEMAEKKGLMVRQADLNQDLPFEAKSFDVVISNQVIEHLFYPVKFIEEIHRILKPRGYSVVSTENLSSWDNVLALTLGYTPFSMEFDNGLRKVGNPFSPHDKEVKPGYIYPHVRTFAWNGLVELAKFARFKLEASSGNGHIMGRIGELADPKHCRFVTLKMRKLDG